MSSRERKRAERRKRKDRSGGRAEFEAQRQARAARTEAKNQAARDALEPLEPDERPTIVTIAAVISGVLALGSLITYLAGVELGELDDFGTRTGETAKPNLVYTVASTIVLGMMTYGLWKARYWAVLGFQTILILIIVVTVLALVVVTEVPRALALTAVLAVASVLFYRMVKAMARIQMPDRGGNFG